MKYSYNEINNILKTLPIGYYIGRDVKIELSEGDKSYYIPAEDTITVSLENINRALSHITNIEESDIEEITRGIVYHEVSHAFLTPRDLHITREMNIFEDERIETLLENLYLNTNFKRLAKLINDYNGEKAKDAEEAFYNMVRFRDCEEESFLNRVKDIIHTYSHLNNKSLWWEHDTYQIKVRDLHNDFVNWWNEQQEKQKEEQKEEQLQQQEEQDEEQEISSMTSDEVNNGGNGDERQESITNEGDQPGDNNEDGEDYEEDENKDDEEYDSSFAKDLVSKAMNYINNPKMMEKVSAVLRQIKKHSQNSGSAINSYSGVFNPRSVMRDDYKYFLQSNRSGHQKAFSKTHLSLFIDISGSYYNNEDTTNQLLFALNQFEKQNEDFSYDLVTINTEVTHKKKGDRQIKCYGGNKLPYSLWELVRKLQKPSENNYNIVLFDGDALSDDTYKNAKNFGAFNLSNTAIISNYANEGDINRYCPNAKKTFTNNYTNELESNIINVLRNIIR